MEKKFKITIVFGEKAANFQREMQYETIRELKEGMQANDVYGLVVTREFNTLTEKEAYLQGVEDMDGCFDWYIFENI